jgi:hypothetical protein
MACAHRLREGGGCRPSAARAGRLPRLPATSVRERSSVAGNSFALCISSVSDAEGSSRSAGSDSRVLQCARIRTNRTIPAGGSSAARPTEHPAARVAALAGLWLVFNFVPMRLRQMGIPVTLVAAGALWLMFMACLISPCVILIEV